MDKYLIDTHILLWIVSEPKKLSKNSNKIISNLDNKIIVSLVSFWEIAIKSSLGKLDFNTSIKELSKITFQKEIEIIQPQVNAISIIQKLPFYKFENSEHRDPFDRMLIAQAITENIPIISADDKFDLYPEIERIW